MGAVREITHTHTHTQQCYFCPSGVYWKSHHTAGLYRDKGTFLERRHLQLLLKYLQTHVLLCNSDRLTSEMITKPPPLKILPAFSGFRTAGFCTDLNFPQLAASYLLSLRRFLNLDYEGCVLRCKVKLSISFPLINLWMNHNKSRNRVRKNSVGAAQLVT